MIVKCEQCQTRFRIADEKVPDRGLRVRCAKCQHTFRVEREVPAPGGALFGTPTPPAGPGTGDLLSALTSAPPEVPASGAGFGVPGAGQGADPFADFDNSFADPFAEPTRVGPVPTSLLDQSMDPDEEPRTAITTPAQRAAIQELFAKEGFSLSGPDDDAFAAPGSASGTAPERSLFDMPEPTTPLREDLSALGLPLSPDLSASPESQEEVASPASAASEGAQPLARIALSSVRLTPGGPLPPGFPPTALVDPPAAVDPEAAALRSAQLRARRRGHAVLRWSGALVLGLVFFVAGAVYTEQGVTVRGLSPERVVDAWVGARGLELVDVTNGLYETQAGTPIFYIRGEVENRDEPQARVRVRAEVLDGDAVVQSAESYVGGMPTPEELHGLVGEGAITSLQQKLEQRAVSLETGARAPFLVAFQQFPPDLARYRLRVQLSSDAPRAIVSP